MKKISFIINGVKNPRKTIAYILKLIDSRFLITARSRARGKGERIIVDDWSSARDSKDFTLLAHIQRYEWVLPMVRGMYILDDGCGTGYGTYYLACNGVKHIIGIDISKNAISYAKKHYRKRNLEYRVMDGCDLEFEDGTFDAIISFDVLEHLNSNDQEKFCAEAMRVLKQNGVFIVGLPNAKASLKGNPFHLKELTLEEFKQLLKNYFSMIALFGQDILVNKERAKKNWYRFASNITYQDLVIVDDDLEEVFGLLAICKKQLKPITT